MTRRRTCTLVALVLSVLLVLPGRAGATTAIERVERERHDLLRTIDGLRSLLEHEMREQERRITHGELVLARGGHVSGVDTWDQVWEAAQRHDRRHAVAFSRFRRRIERRIDAIRARRDGMAAWLDRLVFRVCPVEGYSAIYPDFGEMVRLPGVPVHRHEGNDITAPAGTPIRAPFDGYVSSSWGKLGGLEVRVEGAHGYVYNAHLAGLGHLGWVKAGAIIGYVGATGDATAAHDHLEWHPGGGGPVDPYSLLAVACLPA